jgi:hypothetical protein
MEVRVRAIIQILTVLLLACSLLNSEEIELKDGSKISGKLTAVEGNVFHVKTAYGEIQVPRSDVVQIRFPENGAKAEGDVTASKPTVSPVDESLDGTAYSNRTAHFQVNVPPGWTIAPELRQQNKDIIAGLESEDQAQFFVVTPEKYSGSLKTYELLVETQMQGSFQDFEKVSEALATLDGRNGLRLVLKAKKGTTTLKFVVYILQYESRMIRLTFFTLEPLYNDAEPIFDKIAKSYHSTADKPVAHLTKPIVSGQ